MLSTHFVTGAPSWLDLGSTDTAAAADFYGAVFGWSFDSAGPEAGGYGFFRKDGKTVAAVGPLTEEGASPAWTVYFQTSSGSQTRSAPPSPLSSPHPGRPDEEAAHPPGRCSAHRPDGRSGVPACPKPYADSRIGGARDAAVQGVSGQGSHPGTRMASRGRIPGVLRPY